MLLAGDGRIKDELAILPKNSGLSEGLDAKDDSDNYEDGKNDNYRTCKFTRSGFLARINSDFGGFHIIYYSIIGTEKYGMMSPACGNFDSMLELG